MINSREASTNETIGKKPYVAAAAAVLGLLNHKILRGGYEPEAVG